MPVRASPLLLWLRQPQWCKQSLDETNETSRDEDCSGSSVDGHFYSLNDDTTHVHSFQKNKEKVSSSGENQSLGDRQLFLDLTDPGRLGAPKAIRILTGALDRSRCRVDLPFITSQLSERQFSVEGYCLLLKPVLIWGFTSKVVIPLLGGYNPVAPTAFLTPVSRVAKNLLYYVLVGVLLLIRCPLHQHNIPSHQTTSSNIDRGLSAVFSKRSGFSAREEEVLGHHVSLLGHERRK